MRFLEHIRLAAFAGLIAGFFQGTVDILARIFAFSFEWFEFYQVLLISSAFFVLVFLALSIFVELFSRMFKLRITRESLYLFYAVSVFSLLLFIHGFMVIKRVIFLNLVLLHPAVLASLLVFSAAVFVVCLFLLTKGRSLVFNMLVFARTKGFGGLAKACVLFAFFFIVSSFVVDVYLVDQPFSGSNEKLQGRPNILLLVLDAGRADHFPIYGYRLNTSPNLAKLAEESVVFENAIAPSSWSIPSHASIFTGKYPSNHNADVTNQFLSYDQLTLAEVLRKNGYNTAGFVGAILIKARFGMSQGFTTYYDRADFFDYKASYDKLSIRPLLDYAFQVNKLLGADGESVSSELNNKLFSWLEKNSNSTFFVFVNYIDAHDPYTSGSEFKSRFTAKDVPLEEVEKIIGDPGVKVPRNRNISGDIIDYAAALYDTELFNADYNFGKLLEKLDELGIKNNTVIIIVSDHGEELFDHQGFYHYQTLYDEVIRVPLVIYYPEAFTPKRVEKRVGITSIFPTVLDFLNLEVPEDVDGLSLLPLIRNESGYDREYVYSELLARPELGESLQRAVSVGEWKLIEVNPETAELRSSLFNLKNDPKEQNNLYDVEIEKKKLLQGYLHNITK